MWYCNIQYPQLLLCTSFNIHGRISQYMAALYNVTDVAYDAIPVFSRGVQLVA